MDRVKPGLALNKIILFLFRAPRSHKASVEGLPLIRIEHGKILFM